MIIKPIFPIIRFEKNPELHAAIGHELKETKISFPTQFTLQTWTNSVIIKVSVLGLGIRIYWRYYE